MTSGWKAREQALTVGWTVLLCATWALATAALYVSEHGGLTIVDRDELALDLPANCEAHRTSSGYAVSCSER